jgi:hypothetical protein
MKSSDHFNARGQHLVGLFGEIQNASDRVAGISAAAFVDDTLARTIAAHFIELDEKLQERIFEGPSSPLGSFSAKIAIGYAIGLYGPLTCEDLDIIRSIRNTFAHTAAPTSFDDPSIQAKCEQLKTPVRSPPGKPSRPVPKRRPLRAIEILSEGLVDTPKTLFLQTALHITFALGMITRPKYSIKQNRPSEALRYLP